MAEKVARVGVRRAEGCLYFIDTAGDVACVKRGSKSRRKVAKVGVRKAKGYLYFLDASGDVSRSRMARG
jgi:hypothetical protein